MLMRNSDNKVVCTWWEGLVRFIRSICGLNREDQDAKSLGIQSVKLRFNKTDLKLWNSLVKQETYAKAEQYDQPVDYSTMEPLLEKLEREGRQLVSCVNDILNDSGAMKINVNRDCLAHTCYHVRLAPRDFDRIFSGVNYKATINSDGNEVHSVVLGGITFFCVSNEITFEQPEQSALTADEQQQLWRKLEKECFHLAHLIKNIMKDAGAIGVSIDYSPSGRKCVEIQLNRTKFDQIFSGMDYQIAINSVSSEHFIVLGGVSFTCMIW